MQFGYFTMPSHPPERGLYDGHAGTCSLALGRRARLFRGLDRRAPHRTLGAAPGARPVDRPSFDGDQPHPAAPGRLPAAYHHPAELANRVAMLDHLSQGRLNFGIAASGLPSDWAMFNVDGMSGSQPRHDA